jgi:hypothetical protein
MPKIHAKRVQHNVKEMTSFMQVGDWVIVPIGTKRNVSHAEGQITFVHPQGRFVIVNLGNYRESFYPYEVKLAE